MMNGAWIWGALGSLRNQPNLKLNPYSPGSHEKRFSINATIRCRVMICTLLAPFDWLANRRKKDSYTADPTNVDDDPLLRWGLSVLHLTSLPLTSQWKHWCNAQLIEIVSWNDLADFNKTSFTCSVRGFQGSMKQEFCRYFPRYCNAKESIGSWTWTKIILFILQVLDNFHRHRLFVVTMGSYPSWYCQAPDKEVWSRTWMDVSWTRSGWCSYGSKDIQKNEASARW